MHVTVCLIPLTKILRFFQQIEMIFKRIKTLSKNSSFASLSTLLLILTKIVKLSLINMLVANIRIYIYIYIYMQT
jgi:hypothetical protein